MSDRRGIDIAISICLLVGVLAMAGLLLSKSAQLRAAEKQVCERDNCLCFCMPEKVEL